jgi:hypothetical protein
MQQTCYLIEKQRDQWVVSASGAKIMTCKKKSTALKTVRSATVLLHGQGAVWTDQDLDCSHDAGGQASPLSLALSFAFPACWLAGVAMASLEATSLRAMSGDRETA